MFFHIRSGLPKATTEEIFYRHNVCMNCDDFDHKKSQCGVCGCNINKKSQFLNKLAWADQECPKLKWLKIIRK